jgi:cysteine synthase
MAICQSRVYGSVEELAQQPTPMVELESNPYPHSSIYLKLERNNLSTPTENSVIKKAQEIWEQTGGKIDFLFAPLKYDNIVDVGKYLKNKKSSVKIIGVEISEDLVDNPGIDEVIPILDIDAYNTGIKLARVGGFLVGPLTGAATFAALQYANYYGGLSIVISPDDAFEHITSYEQYLKGYDEQVETIRKKTSIGLEMSHQLRVYDNIIQMVANPENPIPMVNLDERINSNPNFSLHLKCEWYNPCGSIKDRTVLSMLNGVEIKKGQTLLEPTSGNTGIALTAIANVMGIPVELAVPKGIPEEKKSILRFLGVKELYEAPDDLCPRFPTEGARGLVDGMMKSKLYLDKEATVHKYATLNQYENLLNVEAHYKTTGPEIWEQTGGKIDYFFAALGTCGTIMGVSKYLKEQNPEIKIIGVEPTKPDHKIPGMKRISDLSGDLVPKILDLSLINEIVEVEDRTAYQTAIALIKKGIPVGPSTGAVLYVALLYADEHEGLGVVIAPDSASKYGSFFKEYLKDCNCPPTCSGKNGGDCGCNNY